MRLQDQRDQPAPRAWWKRPWARLTGSALVLGLLLLVLPGREILAAIQRVPLWAWAAATVVYCALHLVGVVKWRLVMNAGGAGLPLGAALRGYYVGLFANNFLPSLVGGDVVRAATAMKRARNATGVLLGSVVDRMLDIIGLATLSGVAALTYTASVGPRVRQMIWLSAALAAALTIGLVVLVLFVPRFQAFSRLRAWQKVQAALRAVSAAPGAVLSAYLLGLALQASLVVLTWWLGRLLGYSIPLHAWLVVWPLAKVASVMPLTQGGIGVREAAQAVLFAPLGVAAAQAVAVGLAFEVLTLLGGLPGGLLLLVPGHAEPRTARIPGAEPVPTGN